MVVVKKLISALMSMALIMSLCMGSVVFADDTTIDSTKKGSITIHKYDMTAAGNDSVDTDSFVSDGKKNSTAEDTLKKYAIKGVEFTYLKVGDIIQDEDNGVVSIKYEIPEELQTILGLSDSDKKVINGKSYFTSDKINSALSDTLKKGIEAKNKLEEYAKGGTAMDLTSDTGVTSKDNLDLGLYLIVETKVPEEVVSTTDPFFVSIPMTNSEGNGWFYDLNLYPKNQTGNPTIEKLVRNAEGKNATDGSKTKQDDSYIVTDKDKTDFAGKRSEYSYDSSTTASEGDILDYIIVSKLPHITTKATYLTQYRFVDTLSKGIEYEKDSVQIAFYESNPETWAADIKAHDRGSQVGDVKTYDPDVNGEDVKNASVNDLTKATAVWNVASDNKLAKITTGSGKDDASTLTVDVTDKGLKEINEKYSDYYMVVYYQARVNSDATAVLGDSGNPNDVSLTWSRTSEGYYDTLEDEATVFIYGLDITKTFSDNGGNVENVSFILYNVTDGYYVVADNSETVGDNKTYYVTGKTTDRNKATSLVPSKKGKLLVYGLEGDSYELTETKTDDGYTLLKDPVKIEVTPATQDIQSALAGHNGMEINEADRKNPTSGKGRPAGKVDMARGDVVSATAKVGGKNATLSADGTSANAIAGISVVNSKKWSLPQTGGQAIRLLPVLGLLIAGAGIVLTRKKEKDEI